MEGLVKLLAVVGGGRKGTGKRQRRHLLGATDRRGWRRVVSGGGEEGRIFNGPKRGSGDTMGTLPQGDQCADFSPRRSTDDYAWGGALRTVRSRTSRGDLATPEG